MKRVIALASVIALIAVVPTTSQARRARGSACKLKPLSVQDMHVSVDGETATGRYVLPAKPPKTLVVFAHGYGHDSRSWIDHMLRAAKDHGVAAVAMDYRGTYEQRNDDGSTTIRGWFVQEGAADMIAATKLIHKACPTIKETVLFGVSMGGNSSGLALAAAAQEKNAAKDPLFDYWFNVEGAVNAAETYAGASVLAPANAFAANAKADIEAETGGTPATHPEAYRDLAVVTHIDEIAASGVKGVMVIHALEDGLVPYNQGREIAAELAAEQIPTEFYTVHGKGDGESGTTLTGYSGNNSSPLAGHASEKSDTHVVMVTAFERLWALIDDDQTFTGYSEHQAGGF